MVLEQIGGPLKLKEVETPKPRKGEVLIEVSTCGICRTDLHVLEGDLPHPHLPLILGHEVVGRIVELGEGVKKRKIGERVGVAWLGGCCGKCNFCKSDRENLCNDATFNGYLRNGGYAEFCVASEQFCFPLPARYSDTEAAPLLCSGMVGYRAYRFSGIEKKLGFYGFGSAAHLLIQVARAQNKEVYVFTRRTNDAPAKFAKELGAVWVGTSDTLPPEPLDAVIIFAPVGELVPKALQAVGKGGVVVCADIYMSDIPSFPYKLLWEERSIRSIANLALQDAKDFLKLAERTPLKVNVNLYPLEKANEALKDLKDGKFSGSAVLVIKK